LARTASLEIHQINVGQGDCILIVNRDAETLKEKCVDSGFDDDEDSIDCLPFARAAIASAKPKSATAKALLKALQDTVKHAVLIDGGDTLYGTDIVAYMEAFGVVDPAQSSAPKLTVVTTHYHADHYGGLRDVLAKKNEALQATAAPPSKKKQKTTQAVKTIVNRYKPAKIYQAQRNKKADGAGPLLNEYFKYAEDWSDEIIPVLPGGKIDDDDACVISLGDCGANDIPVTLTAIASSQSVWDGGDDLTEVESIGSKPDQNDRSIVLVLEYGSFRYFLGGDIAGTGTAERGNGEFSMPDGTIVGKKKKARKFSQHADVETDVGIALKYRFPKSDIVADEPKVTRHGHCCVFKANHHASMSSVDVYLLSSMRPRIGIITSGVKEKFHSHPTAEVLGRLGLADWDLRPKDLSGDATDEIPNTLTKTVTSATQTANRRGGVYVNEIARIHGNKDHLSDTIVANVKIMGDMVVRPVDEQIQAIQAADVAGTATLDIQVYGSGEQTGLALNGKTELRPVNTTKTDPYPVGPFWHSCDYH
jgi:beta-lactamase superfamily II metal-dependent hydrolase